MFGIQTRFADKYPQNRCHRFHISPIRAVACTSPVENSRYICFLPWYLQRSSGICKKRFYYSKICPPHL